MKKKYINIKEFKPLWTLIKEEKFKLLLASLAIIICETFEIFSGYLNGSAIEEITKLHLKKAVIFLSIYFVLRVFVDGVLYLYARSKLQKIENRISQKLAFNTYKKTLDLPSYAFEKTSSGEIINRVTNDTEVLSSSFEQLLSIVSSILGSVILIFYIFFNSWIIGLEIIIFVIILYFIINKFNKEKQKIRKSIKKEGDRFTSLVNESVRGVREVKTLGIKNNLISDVKYILNKMLNKSYKEIDINSKFYIMLRILKSTLEVGVFITCVVLLYYKQTTLTFFIAMTYYVYRYMWLIENINGFIEVYQKVLVSLNRVNELLQNKLYEDEKFGDEKLKDVKGVIEFKNVTFSYPYEDVILKNFDLKIVPNKKIAIVGKSGQGKSTLFNLLTRVFDPEEGEILLDGVNVRDISEKELRKQISIIRQEPFIFNRTIKENFKLIDSKINIDEIRRYTKMAYIDDYIMSLPKKYDTKLGEGGVNLSGGQKQRLAIARTLCKRSKVILFDEATSALDNDSQKYVKKAIDDLVVDHTVIIVAHRLSTIVDADIIYVVDKGKIVGNGTHEELLKNNSIYKKLYESEL